MGFSSAPTPSCRRPASPSKTDEQKVIPSSPAIHLRKAESHPQVNPNLVMTPRRSSRLKKCSKALRTTPKSCSSSRVSRAPILPNSRVRIVANKRTKTESLLGKEAQIIGEVSQGGWYEVRVETQGGKSVQLRMQRNAFKLIELPIVNLKGDDKEQNDNEDDVNTQMGKNVQKKEEKKGVTIHRLDETTLRRYCQHYNLKVNKNCSKQDLVRKARRHFENMIVNEDNVINSFIELAEEYDRALKAK